MDRDRDRLCRHGGAACLRLGLIMTGIVRHRSEDDRRDEEGDEEISVHRRVYTCIQASRDLSFMIRARVDSGRIPDCLMYQKNIPDTVFDRHRVFKMEAHHRPTPSPAGNQALLASLAKHAPAAVPPLFLLPFPLHSDSTVHRP